MERAAVGVDEISEKSFGERRWAAAIGTYTPVKRLGLLPFSVLHRWRILSAFRNGSRIFV
jgi:hypothetical protein